MTAGRRRPSRDARGCVPKLVILTGGSNGEILLTAQRLTIGRKPSCDVVLDTKFASKLHARLERKHGAYYIADLGSRNHVFVNEDRILGPYRLRDGDLIRIADIEMKYHARPAPRETDETEVFESRPAPTHSTSHEMVIDQGRRDVWIRGTLLTPRLSRQEFELLRLLWEAAGQVRSRDELCDAIWGPGAYDYYLLHRLVYRLKAKLTPLLADRELLKSIPAVGYRLDI